MKQILRLTSNFTTQETHKPLIYISVEKKWQKSSELWRKKSRKRALMSLESLSSETSIIILCLRMICPNIQILLCLLWHNDKVFISQDHLIYWGRLELLMFIIIQYVFLKLPTNVTVVAFALLVYTCKFLPAVCNLLQLLGSHWALNFSQLLSLCIPLPPKNVWLKAFSVLFFWDISRLYYESPIIAVAIKSNK